MKENEVKDIEWQEMIGNKMKKEKSKEKKWRKKVKKE